MLKTNRRYYIFEERMSNLCFYLNRPHNKIFTSYLAFHRNHRVGIECGFKTIAKKNILSSDFSLLFRLFNLVCVLAAEWWVRPARGREERFQEKEPGDGDW